MKLRMLVDRQLPYFVIAVVVLAMTQLNKYKKKKKNIKHIVIKLKTKVFSYVVYCCVMLVVV
mgnify:CR=1 FL=1